MDRWDRKTDFGCRSCMYYVPKAEQEVQSSPEKKPSKGTIEIGRCRHNAPTLKGYPVVFADDWCGQHKKGTNPIRK